jgi:hypothetical protein
MRQTAIQRLHKRAIIVIASTILHGPVVRARGGSSDLTRNFRNRDSGLPPAGAVATEDNGIKNYVSASLNYVNVRLLVDSGASFSCVAENTFKHIVAHSKNARFKLVKVRSNLRLLSATGSSLQIIGEVTLAMRLQNHAIQQKFFVVRNLHHSGVLGMDMLQACNAVIDLGDKSLRLFDNLVTVPLITAQDNNNVSSVIWTVRIPAHYEDILPVCLPQRASFMFNTPALVQAWPGLKQRGLGVAPILVQPPNSQTFCRIINVRPTNQLLRRGTKLAYLSEIDVSDPFNQAALNGIQNQAPAHSLATDEHPSVTTIAFSVKLDAVTATGLNLQQARQRLNPAQFEELIDMLYRYKHLFTTTDDIPLSNLPPVRIPMKDMTPVRVKPYKLSPEIDDLLH